MPSWVWIFVSEFKLRIIKGKLPTFSVTFLSVDWLFQKNANFHFVGWNDIGYSFLVCEDGRVYEGRGWNVEGSHTRGYNRIALGICFIGTFSKKIPLPIAITAGKNLIKCGEDKVCLEVS